MVPILQKMNKAESFKKLEKRIEILEKKLKIDKTSIARSSTCSRCNGWGDGTSPHTCSNCSACNGIIGNYVHSCGRSNNF